MSTTGAESPPPQPSTWEEFREAGLLWWINRMLHLFGWAIVVEVEDVIGPDQTAKVARAYPARVPFRGFTDNVEIRNFRKLTTHIERELPRMKKDAEG